MQCAQKMKLDWNYIEQCSGEKKADELCNAFHDQITHSQSTRILSIMFGSVSVYQDFSVH